MNEDYTPDLTPSIPKSAADTLSKYDQLKEGTILQDAENKNNKYTVHTIAGFGGNSNVYKATDEKFRRDVALKLVNNAHLEQIQMIQKEAKLIAEASSHHVVPIYDLFKDQEGRFVAVMPYYSPEKNLNSIVNEQKISHETASNFIDQYADAVNYCHEKGIRSRDLKPSNSFIDESGNLQISDFGIVTKNKDPNEEAYQSTIYFSPPEYLDEKAGDIRGEIYSMGAIGYNLLMGKPPY